MEYDKNICPVVDVDGIIAAGKQFDLDITLPKDNRNVIYGVVKDCHKEPVCDAVVKLIEVIKNGCEKEERRPVSHTFTDKEGEFVFGPLCPDRFYEIQIWVNEVKHVKICATCEHEGPCLKGIDCKKSYKPCKGYEDDDYDFCKKHCKEHEVEFKPCNKPCKEHEEECKPCHKPCKEHEEECKPCHKPCKEHEEECKPCHKPCKEHEEECKPCEKYCKEYEDNHKPCDKKYEDNKDCDCKPCEKKCEVNKECDYKSYPMRPFGYRR